MRPYFEAEGFMVYNCNLESELKVFDFVKYEDAIAEETGKLGDVEHERTWGMYSKPDERQKWAEEDGSVYILKGHQDQIVLVELFIERI